MISRSALHLAVGAVCLFSTFLLPTSLRANGEPAYLMPTGDGGGSPDNGIQPFDANPAQAGSKTRAFLTYGTDADGNTIPLKTLRITNNTDKVVYPIMRAANTDTLSDDKNTGLYNPYDPVNKEYRGYIGYSEGGKYYFGLKPGQSILVRLTLVFWNGARIGVGTDGRYLTSTKPNPLNYDPNAFRAIAPAETSSDTITNGVVMWYRSTNAEAQAPADDVLDQLAEWSIRDHDYLINPGITTRTKSQIPDSELVTLINYDVSNVDSLYLPISLAANDAWVLPPSAGPGSNRATWKPGSVPAPFGWTGAINSIDFLQSALRAFTAGTGPGNKNQLLGDYFEGRGWPYYNIPNPDNDPDFPIKIPSGANVFAESPLRGKPIGTTNSYADGTWQNQQYMLSSGGTEPILSTVGSAPGGDSPGSTVLTLFKPGYPQEFAFIRPGMLVSANVPSTTPPTPNPIADGTTVVSVDTEAGTVTLSKPLTASSANLSFTFKRPVRDYAVEAMARLWYSWAEYYRANWKGTNAYASSSNQTIPASIDVGTATLRFSQPQPGLVLGMAVTGPALDDAQTEVGKHQGDAVILEIADDKKSVLVSQLATKTSTGENYTFAPPQELLWTPKAPGDVGYPLVTLDFSKDNLPPSRKPYEFAQKVYLVMASMNQIGQPNNNEITKFMQDIIGANMGFIFSNDNKKLEDGIMLMAFIRDMIKSVLRGVSDFTKYPDILDASGNHISWYPAPSLPTGGQTFNVFNLDPFVWFVHVQLKFSGYGFSVDDDKGDVGAGGASSLQLSITGTNGLKNTNPWSIQAQFGPVKDISLAYSGPASPTNGDSPQEPITTVSNTTPIRVTSGVPHHLSNGDTVLIADTNGDPAVNGTFKVQVVSKTEFDLYDAATGNNPIAPSGTYTGGGYWRLPNRAYVDTVGATMPGNDLSTVFYRVQPDDSLGTFQGTFVAVNGVTANKNTGEKFRVWQLGQANTGRLILNTDLTDANGNPLPAGKHTFTFYGDGDAIQTTTPSSGPTRTDHVKRVQSQLSRAQAIEDPEQRARAVQQLREWLRIVRRGVDPTTRYGELRYQLIVARNIKNPERRKRVIDRLRDQLESVAR